MHRRQFLASSAVAVGGLVGLSTAAAGTETDWRSDNVDAKEIDHRFDETFLERYRPRFIAETQVARRYKGLFGYKATSPEYDYEYAYYWSRLTHQEGLSFVSKDSKIGDTEPVICAVDPDSGDLEHVIWTNYHHYAAAARADRLHVVEDGDGDGEHPVFEIDPRWHNYYAADERQGDGVTGPYPLRNWLAARDQWLRNDVFANTHDPAVEDPEVMETRESWWADGTPDAFFARFWATFGRGGIGRADHLETDVRLI